MVENFEGRYCGTCHGTVAFPMLDCQRCHKGNAAPIAPGQGAKVPVSVPAQA